MTEPAVDPLPLDLLAATPPASSGRALDALDATPVTDVLEHLLDVGTTSEDDLRLRFDGGTPLVAVLAALRADGLVVGDGAVGLTPEGLEVATDRVRKHRLAERLLTDLLGVPWRTVHHEARRWEVLLSDEVEARVVDLLHDPGTCPHGNPIPGSGNAPSQVGARTLATVGPGLVRVVRVGEEVEADDAALALLDDAGFVPGSEAEVLVGLGPDGVHVAGATADATIPVHVAERTWVEVLG